MNGMAKTYMEELFVTVNETYSNNLQFYHVKFRYLMLIIFDKQPII